MVAKYLYDAWGNCTISSETTNTIVANANPIRYRGYYYDDDTGLYYCNARYYSPKWRRFISPATNTINPSVVNGLNSYVYAGNNPIGIVCCNPSATNRQTISDAGMINGIVFGDKVSNRSNPHWFGGFLSGMTSLHGFVDSVSSYLAGAVDGLLSYIDIPKFKGFQSGLGKYSNWLLGIGVGLDVISSAYNNYTDAQLTSGQKWASFGTDVGYIAVKSSLSYLAGSLVTKGAVALGYYAMGATLGATIGGVTIGLLGSIAIGAGVVVLGVIVGTVLIAVLSDAADNWWDRKKEEWFS